MMPIVRKIALIRKKVSMWGWKGVFEYLTRPFRGNPQRAFFVRNAKRFPCVRPETGITIVGPLSTPGKATSKVLRDFARSLKAAGIPFQTYDTGSGETSASELDGILTPVEDFRIRRFSHLVEMIFPNPIPDGTVEHRARIVFWEFNEGVGDAFHCLVERNDDIIAMSDFNYEYFRREFGSRVGVFKILYPLQIDVDGVLDKAACRKKFGFASSDFIVFFNFSYSSGWWRKNAPGAVRAFALAFRNVPDAKLVLKTRALQAFEDRKAELLRIAETEGVRDRVLLFDEYLTQKDVYNLTNACDVYLSLHRAEGFGLGLAEAMILSKAVVATDYSSTTEFCKEEHALLVPFEMVDVKPCEKDTFWYRNVTRWAEPDIKAAAEALKRLYEDEGLRARLGRNARDFILKTYSTERFRESVRAFLDGKTD